MDIGVSVGPYVDRIERVPGRFEFVELAVGEGELPAADLEPDRIADRLAARDAGLVVHLPYRQPLSTPVDGIDRATLAYLDDLLERAGAAGATTAVAHPSGRGTGARTEPLTDRLADLAARGEDRGITVCYETVGYAGGPALDRVGDLATAADAGVCLDLGYAFLEADADGVVAFLDSYGDLVEHLHVHGVRRRGDTHIPLGSGDLPLDRLGPAVADAAPDATATVEVFTDDTGYLTASADRWAAAIGDGVED